MKYTNVCRHFLRYFVYFSSLLLSYPSFLSFFTCQSLILRRIFVLSFIHGVCGIGSYSFRNVYIFTSGGSIQSQAGLFFATQRCSVNIDMCKHVTGVYNCINTVFTPLRLSACLPVLLPPIHSVLSWLVPKRSVPQVLQSHIWLHCNPFRVS